MSESHREHYEERAAIMHFDGGMPLERAERNAWWLACQSHCPEPDRRCAAAREARCGRS